MGVLHRSKRSWPGWRTMSFLPLGDKWPKPYYDEVSLETETRYRCCDWSRRNINWKGIVVFLQDQEDYGQYVRRKSTHKHQQTMLHDPERYVTGTLSRFTARVFFGFAKFSCVSSLRMRCSRRWRINDIRCKRLTLSPHRMWRLGVSYPEVSST